LWTLVYRTKNNLVTQKVDISCNYGHFRHRVLHNWVLEEYLNPRGRGWRKVGECPVRSSVICTACQILLRWSNKGRLGWVGHVACIKNKKNGYRNKNIGRRPFGRPKDGDITIRFATFLMFLGWFNDAFHTVQIKKNDKWANGCQRLTGKKMEWNFGDVARVLS